jgi:hypothetical protein
VYLFRYRQFAIEGNINSMAVSSSQPPFYKPFHSPDEKWEREGKATPFDGEHH